MTRTGVRSTDRPIDQPTGAARQRRYETSPRRNSTRISPLHAAHLQHLCLPRLQRPDWKSSFSRRPRHARSPIPRGAPLALVALTFPCSSLPAPGPALRRQAETMSGARASRQSRTVPADFLPATRRGCRLWRTHGDGLRENRPRSIADSGIFTLCSETASFFLFYFFFM